MKYAKYILIVIGLYFGVKYHNTYLNTKKEIESLEDSYKDEKTRKFKEYRLNFENIKFQRDSVNLYLDQKYLVLTHNIYIQYLQGKFDEKTYGVKLQELKKCESEEILANTESWLGKYEKNNWPETPVPNLLYQKRNSSKENSNALFVICGILLPIFLLIDRERIKDLKQPQKPKHENQTLLLSNNQLIYNGQTLESISTTTYEGDNIQLWVDQQGNHVEVPDNVTQPWLKAKQVDPNANPNIVTRKFGKTEVVGEKDQSSNIVLSDPMSKEQSLGKEGEPNYVSEEEYAQTVLSQYDKQQQAQQEITFVYEGQIITRINHPDAKDQDGEMFQTEGGEYVYIGNDEVAELKQAKQQNPNNIVTRVYGKTLVTGTKNQSGNIVLPDLLSLDEAESLKEEVESATGGKATVDVKPKTYQVTIVPMPVFNPAIKEKIEEETAQVNVNGA
jgi:hypothetical protein